MAVRFQREEQQALLREVFECPGWRQVACAALEQRRAALAEKCVTDQRLSEGEWRILQHHYAILTEMLDDPGNFFLPGTPDE